MNVEELQGALSLSGAQLAGEWYELPAGKLLTLHLASSGVGLGVTKIEALKLIGGQVHARNSRGDLYAFAMADVFACNIDLGESRGRKAGFSA
ncbi:MAG: hypothetical protein RJA70_274 [Pseudomonadota bacterium]|jgi:hypothetical protein